MGRLKTCTYDNRYLLVAIALSVIGFAVRMYRLDFVCMDIDESKFTFAIVSAYDFSGILDFVIGGCYNPPLYFLVAEISTIAFGVTPFAIRFPSAVFGSIAIFLAFLLGRYTYSDISGCILSAFVFISFPFVYYSQIGRAYMLLLCVFIIFILLFIRIVRDDNPSWKLYVALGTVAALCLWTHFYAVVPIITAFAILIARTPRSIFWLAIPFAIICIPFLGYTDAVLHHLSVYSTIPHEWYWLSASDFIYTVPMELFGQACIIIVPLFLSSFIYYKDDITRHLSTICIVSFLSTIPMTIFTAMSPRYILLVSPLAFMVATLPICNYIQHNLTEKWKLVCIALSAIAFTAFAACVLWFWFTATICPYIL